jgi:GntR family transcriptional regulator/MocR family aminotransferase
MIPSHAGRRIVLDRAAGQPLYRQLYDRFRDAIAQGKLAPGDRVPSVRDLASELGLARGTVEAAYDLLAGEGYFVARGQAGTVVAPQLAGASVLPKVRTRGNAGADAREDSQIEAAARPLQLGLPALDAFPRKLWVRLAARRVRSMPPSALAYPDPAGYPPLREAVAAYLLVSRGIACSAEQVFVTAGYPGALNLVRRALLDSGDTVWLEDPCYWAARRFVETTGARIAAVPVDADGLRVPEGVRRAPAARLAIVTPAHQSPLGMSLALSRRLELLRWAADAGAWIVEDDYDGEFRYRGRPLPALKSLDREGRVLYAGTFSKVLFPALRLAYLVVPEEVVGAFDRACRAYQGECPWLMQAVVADFMHEGHFLRHLKKMRGLYARRRETVAAALTAAFPDRLRIELQAGGLHLVARLALRESDRRLARLAQGAGFGVQPLSEWAIERECGQALLIGFTNVDTPAAAESLVRRLKAAWRR